MTSSPSLVSQLIRFLEQQPGWRLWIGLSGLCLLTAEIIVGVMDLLLKGEITADYLLTGLVVTSFVAPVALAGVIRLLENSRQVKVDALELQSLRVSKYMQVGLDAARMMFWELDLARGTLAFDDRRLHWLGLEPSEALHTMAGFLDKVHPDDRVHLMLDVDGLPVLRPRDRTREYRMQLPDGSWGWHRVAAEVAERDMQGRATVMAGGTVNVTAIKQAEFALRASEDRANQLASMLRLISDNVPDMIWAKDLEGRYLFANKAMCEQLLCAASTDEVIGQDDLFFARRQRDTHPDNLWWQTYGEICRATDAETLKQGKTMQFEESGYVRGKWMVLDAYKAPLLDRGQVIGVVGSARDVTAQRALQDKLSLASMVLEHSSEALLVTDADNRVVDVNPAFTILTGYTREEVIGQNPRILNSGRQSAEFFKTMWHDLNTRGHWQGELWNRRKNGEVYAEWLTINTIYHEDGSVHRRVALFSDVTEKKLAEELIWRQANFDTLTSLPNRRMFMDRLGQGLIKAQRNNQKLALLYLDLDRFKEVNDSLGHDAGDALLADAARRITGCVRATDTVARLAGDEFTVILPELEDGTRVEGIALNIIAALALPFDIDGHTAQVTVSIGITLYPDDGADLNLLMENADQAMYEAKRAGRNRFSFFTRDTRLRAAPRPLR